MAPNKHYPVATVIQSFGKPLSPVASAQFGSTLLANVLHKPMNDYHKKVIHPLKSVFEKPSHILSMRKSWSVTVRNGSVTCTFNAELLVKHSVFVTQSVLDALSFLNLFYFQILSLLTEVTRFCKALEIGEVEVTKASEIGEVEIAKLKKLKGHLIPLANALDRILLVYPCVENMNLPNVDDVKRMAKKLRKGINNINPQNLSQLISSIDVTEEDILCSVLGLKSDVADRLKSLDPVVRSHQSDLYFLQGFLADQDESENPEVVECFTDTAVVSSKLQEMGFTQSRSVAIAKWIADQDWAEHQSLLAWAQHYIKDLFTYDIFLNDYVGRYPYEERTLNTQFSVPVERYGDEDVVVTTKVPVIHTTYSAGPQAIEKIAQQHRGKRIYYHGTDHMSAKSILEDGINLGMGKPGCDFSSGSGFYLVDSSKYATEWAMKSKAAAVLVYGISEGSLNDHKVLDLLNEREKWKEVREHFRNGKKLSRNTKQECRNCDYIKGPIDSTPQSIQQICIKSEAMSVHIGDAANICGVIFMNGQQT